MIFVNGRFIFVSRPNWTLCRIVRKQSHYYVTLFKYIKKKKIKLTHFNYSDHPCVGLLKSKQFLEFERYMKYYKQYKKHLMMLCSVVELLLNSSQRINNFKHTDNIVIII